MYFKFCHAGSSLVQKSYYLISEIYRITSVVVIEYNPEAIAIAKSPLYRYTNTCMYVINIIIREAVQNIVISTIAYCKG